MVRGFDRLAESHRVSLSLDFPGWSLDSLLRFRAMSEFKFACPICGQHITADSKDSGSKISCPTCFRKIVVPQAPSSSESKFVLSASEADKPRPPLPKAAEVSPVEKTSDKTRIPVALIVLFVVLAAAGATVFSLRHTLFHSKPPADGSVANNGETNSPDASAEVRPDYTGTNLWSMDLSNVMIPDNALAGSLHHQAFEVERATLSGSNLTLRIGTKGQIELGLNIYFFNRQPEELSGKSAEVKPTDTTAPRVVMHWRENERRSETFHKGYAMKIEFGPASGNALPGKLFISLPDDSKSWVAGSFHAEIHRPGGTKPKPPAPQSLQSQTH